MIKLHISKCTHLSIEILVVTPLFFYLFQLNQTVGSIEAIAKSSKEYILETTDLSPTTAQTIPRFFRDPKFYLAPKFG